MRGPSRYTTQRAVLGSHHPCYLSLRTLEDSSQTSSTSISHIAPSPDADQIQASMSVCPYLYYNDAKAAKIWLTNVCGFEPGFMKEMDDGTIGHAEVKHGAGFIYFATAKPTEGMKSPIDVGAETASVCVAAVKDVDGLHDRAKAAGGNITKAPYNTCYGSREFEMKDPEGRVWFFGSYSPTDNCPEDSKK
ncbi:hypothetical protein WJX75_006532 [Coccomyxa subellipsoidea]|uniref:VOC domain-containing protein n=1 Tax=Coccomyxa subellipsoidea TaxID=248742 RepID=A0ABR2YJJ6_9CHLO